MFRKDVCIYIETCTKYKDLYNFSFLFTFATCFFSLTSFFLFFLSLSLPSYLFFFLSMLFLLFNFLLYFLSLIFLFLLSISQNFLSFLGWRPIWLNIQLSSLDKDFHFKNLNCMLNRIGRQPKKTE